MTTILSYVILRVMLKVDYQERNLKKIFCTEKKEDRSLLTEFKYKTLKNLTMEFLSKLANNNF